MSAILLNIISKNVEQTYNLASKLAKHIKGGDIILLNGDLGAGKTTFVKGFAKEIGVKIPVTSPTFNLLKTYETENYTLVHVDAYRLEGGSFDELYDYANEENVIFIEWSNCLADQELIEQHLAIDIKYIRKNQRWYIISAKGERYENLLKELSNEN